MIRFLLHIVSHSNSALDKASARELWNKILVREKQDTLELIRKFKSHYNLAIYSNTNQIHCEFMQEYYTFFDEFEKIYLSHEVGLIKPDPNVFSMMLREFGAKPDECVFIDDTLPNIEAAKAAGWHAVHFRNVDDIVFLLKYYS